MISNSLLTDEMIVLREKLDMLEKERFEMHEIGEVIEEIIDDIDCIMPFLLWYESQCKDSSLDKC